MRRFARLSATERPSPRDALEIAFLDLAGRVAGVPLHRLLGGKLRETVELCYAVSIDTPSVMAEEVRRWPACRCFKVKVAGNADDDVKRLEAILSARPEIDVWLDANQSYQPIQLERFLDALRDFDNIRCFEQPVRSEELDGAATSPGKEPISPWQSTKDAFLHSMSPALRRCGPLTWWF